MARRDQNAHAVSMIPTFANFDDAVPRPGWAALAEAVISDALFHDEADQPVGIREAQVIRLDDYR